MLFDCWLAVRLSPFVLASLGTRTKGSCMACLATFPTRFLSFKPRLSCEPLRRLLAAASMISMFYDLCDAWQNFQDASAFLFDQIDPSEGFECFEQLSEL